MRIMKLLPIAVLAVALLPADGEAQRRPARCCANPWSFSPYAGAFKDAFDVSPDGDETGWMAGFRFGYAIGGRTRLTGNVGYAESDDVSSGPILPDRVIYDNQYIIATGGAEYDILPGTTSVSLGTELGGAWRKVVLDDDNVSPPVGAPDDGYSFYFAIIPSLTVRHGFSSRTALEIGLRDFIFPEDNVEHAPALNIGFRFR